MATRRKVESATQTRPRMLINGELVEASDKKTFPLYNPATREKVADVPEATTQDADDAVAAAKAAFPAWSVLDPSKRGEYLAKLAALIRQNQDELSYLEAISMGKPVETYIDGYVAAGHFDYFAQAWPHIQGQASTHTPGHITMTLRQPYGVVAAIIPWNMPVLFLGSKAAPALITGNTVVLKSSEKAPLAVCRVAELVKEAGFPPGVFNIISGHGLPAGEVLSKHMNVRAITFTGSTRTGRIIQENAAKSNLKRVLLELGGKSPAIVFDDAPLARAVRETVHSIQLNSGQLCMANSRVYVQKGIASVFIEEFKKQFGAARLGDPLLTTGVDMGPQADEVQYRNVLRYIEEGMRTSTLAIGGKGRLESKNGFFIEPTVFINTPEDAAIMKEEIFGPVISINMFETEAEAIAKANDTEYGLYAAVFTKDVGRALRVAKALESGYVGVNCTSPTLGLDLPFGGYKGSGQSREGWLHSMNNFLEEKSVIIHIEED